MKELQLPVPTIFIVMGLPGAGKSFFARQFAAAYDLPYIALDKIRHELFNEPVFTPSEQDIISRISNYMAEELLRAHHSFVIDGTTNNIKTQRLSLRGRAREYGFRALVIWVQVDEPTAKNRSIKGVKREKYSKPLPEPTFESWKKQLTPPSGETYVVISGKHTFPAQHKMVLRKVLPAPEPKREVPKPAEPMPVRRVGTVSRPENRRIHIS